MCIVHCESAQETVLRCFTCSQLLSASITYMFPAAEKISVSIKNIEAVMINKHFTIFKEEDIFEYIEYNLCSKKNI